MDTSPFTDSERALVKHFLGYANFRAMAGSIQLGYPSQSQPLFLVDDAFGRVDPESRAIVRLDLCQCQAVEKQIIAARGRLGASQVGNVKMNPRELDILSREHMRWIVKLCDDLGVMPNPWSQAMYQGIDGMGGINARVM